MLIWSYLNIWLVRPGLQPNQVAPPLISPNEVEIIVTSKMGPVRQYAERIEGRLKGQGFAVDVLFPHEDIPMRKVLADLSSRGTLFGILVTPTNQEQGSITLNILFGQPEGKSSFRFRCHHQHFHTDR